MVLNLVIGLLSAFFLFASSIKIFGWQKKVFEIQLEMFESYGLNRQIMFLVGCAELFGAIAIWFQSSWVGPLRDGDRDAISPRPEQRVRETLGRV